MRLMVPAAYGGRNEAIDPVGVGLVRESLMAVCSAADSLFALQGIGSYAITIADSEEQKRTWLPRVATGEVLAALALTEPTAGSDLKSMITTAVEQDAQVGLLYCPRQRRGSRTLVLPGSR